MKEYKHENYMQNREKIRKQQKENLKKPGKKERKNELTRKWYHKNREKSLLANKKYCEKNPEHMKEYKHENYMQNREKILASRKKDYAIPKNKEKQRMRCSRYNNDLNNKEKLRQAKRRYRSTEKGRTIEQNKMFRRRMQKKKSKHILTTNELLEIKKKYTICIYCGIKEKLTIEHVKPLIKNGQHTKENVMRACLTCNTSKNDTPLKDWLKGHRCKEKNINRRTIHPDLLRFLKEKKN
jgi:hypothetical protein